MASTRSLKKLLRAQVTYPIRPPEAHMVSGRVIDSEHWSKVETIFPIQQWQQASTEMLFDKNESREVGIRDGRLVSPTLEKNGFQLFTFPSVACEEGFDKDAYYEETKAFLSAAVPGAKEIVPFHHLIRDSRRDNLDSSKGPKSEVAHAPVSRVHGDYTTENAPMRLSQLQEQGRVEAKDVKNYAIINTWRSIGDVPVRSKPLALLDASSLDFEAVFPYALVHDTLVGYNYSVAFDPAHKWSYFPKMKSDELLAFFTFDGRQQPPRLVFHTAIEEPMDHRSNPPPRVSVEVRSLITFD